MKQKILVVDDNPHFINNIIDILSANNSEYYFYPTKNGEVAYKLAVAKEPDLIITDWDMPVVNGIELIKKLKKNRKTREIPVIMATAVMITSEDLKIALDAGAIDYVRKPIDPIELIARTKSVLKITEYYTKLIENKNRELAENTLQMIKSTEFNTYINKQLTELHDEITNKNDKILTLHSNIVNQIDSKIKHDSWHKFDNAFDAANNDFKKNLLKKFPNLTNAEQKLSVFLKLGMNTKDIAIVLYQTSGSIKVARARLRKKLRLITDQNLQSFLSSF